MPTLRSHFSGSAEFRRTDCLIGWGTKLAQSADQFQLQNVERALSTWVTPGANTIGQRPASKGEIRPKRLGAEYIRTAPDATVKNDRHAAVRQPPAMAGNASIVGGPKATCRPPWFDTTIPSQPKFGAGHGVCRHAEYL